MKAEFANAVWEKLGSLPKSYYLAFAVSIAAVGAIRAVVRSRRNRGSIKPIRYFSYITHSSTPSVCAQCGVEVSEKTKKYCLANPQRFGGMVYCDRHRRKR